jgi:hypothetical protein
VELRFLYIGTSDTARDLPSWLGLPGAALRWRFQHFGADVAAVDTGGAPLLLLADHRPAGSVLPIFAVNDLVEAGAELRRAGWELQVGPAGTPEGPATVWHDRSGTAIALLQVDRPGALDHAYGDAGNTSAVRLPS